MKNKIILILLSTLLTVSMIGCGSKEKQSTSSTDSKATVSADEDVQIKKDYGEDIVLISKSYLKAFNGEVGLESESYLVGTVTADKDNLSKIEALEKTRDERTEICFVDTTGVTDLKVGDVVSIGVIKDEKDKIKKEFRYRVEPMSMAEYKKTVAERTGDTRDKSTKDENVYIKDQENKLYFAPELSMASSVSLLPTRVVDTQYLNNIKGTYDGEVVLINIGNGSSMLVATKVDDKCKYFWVSVNELKRFGISDRDYKMGDKVKVTIGTVENEEVGVSVK
jgi:ribosomal protein L21E